MSDQSVSQSYLFVIVQLGPKQNTISELSEDNKFTW